MDIGNYQNIPSQSDVAVEKARLLKQQSAAVGPNQKELQKIRKVSQDFEAMFVGMMMKSMRETVGKDKLTGGGHGEEIYRSMLDQEYATIAAKRAGGVGLAKQIEKDLIRQENGRVQPRKVQGEQDGSKTD